MKQQDKKTKQKTERNIHAKAVGTRGRVFEGTVVKVFPMRAVIESERTVRIKKYERFYKKKMRLHSRIPVGMSLQVGDYVSVQECRPLSKIVHSIVISKIRSSSDMVEAAK